MTTAAERSRSLRCVLSGALEPALNMALDEALLRADAPTPAATLRLYQWSPPGLSLGYFQRAAAVADVPGDHAVVRRVTGGGAIYHQGDLTFALTADLELLPTAIGDSYALVHGAIARALSAIGVPLARPGTGPQLQPRPDETWCLGDSGPCDVRTPDGRKIVGSAQRRIRQPRPRLLHHGSIVLTAPAATPDCGAIDQHVDPAAALPLLQRELGARMAEALGLGESPGAVTDAELGRAAELAQRRYGNRDFTYRR